jgi:DNA-binding GntR family transcriptional regulator
VEEVPQPREKKATRAETVGRQLEDEIVSGALAPGTRLEEKALAARFRMSRTPVREALQQLVSKSLAIRQPYRGVVVAEVSRERLDGLFEAMAEVEAMCGRIAAQRMTTWERAELTRVNERLAGASRVRGRQDYEALNEQFHELIYHGTHNETLASMALSLRLELSPYRRFQFRDAERIARSHREHQAIVDAIILRDPAAAEMHLRRHLLSAAEASLAAVSDVSHRTARAGDGARETGRKPGDVKVAASRS